jgi:hypothetical protein
MAKRSRRQRRQEIEKQKQVTPGAAPAEPLAADVQSSTMVAEEFTPAPAKMTQPAPVTHRKSAAINFAHEYYYVFRELTTILIIAVIMVVVMIGLSFTI